MNRIITSGLMPALTAFLIAGLVHAEAKEGNASKALEVKKSTQKQEVRESQIGYRDTLLFYTFPDQKSVLKLQIGNKDKSFPMA